MGQGSYQNTGYDLDFLQKHIKTIIKFQALFRGHLARRHTAFIMNSRRVSYDQYF